MDGILRPMLFILLPALGCGIAALLAWRAFRDARLEFGIPEPRPGQPDRGKMQLLVMVQMTVASPIFGFVCYILVGMAVTPPADDAVLAMGVCIGLSGLFTALGQGTIARAAARDLARNPRNFGRHVIAVLQCEPVMLLAFVVFMLSVSATPAPAGLAAANYIMGGSSVGAVVSGILAANIDPSQMAKRVVRGAMGTLPALLGFLAAVWLLLLA